jgi:hypothetical protein
MSTLGEMAEFVQLWDLVSNFSLDADQPDTVTWKWTRMVCTQKKQHTTFSSEDLIECFQWPINLDNGSSGEAQVFCPVTG